jgi:hypothetical protein
MCASCVAFCLICVLLLHLLVLLQPAASYDVVFSNWLLMYLSDEEVEALAVKALSWVSECLYSIPFMCGVGRGQAAAGKGGGGGGGGE